MNISDLIKQNNQLRVGLTPNNLAYYEKMIVYLRASQVRSRRVEELLLELLDHLLTAQRDGRSAEDVFGPEPEKYCKDLATSVTSSPRLERFWHAIYAFSLGLIITFAMEVAKGLYYYAAYGELWKEVSVISVLSRPVVIALLVQLHMYRVRKQAFNSSKRAFLVEFGFAFIGILIIACIHTLLYVFFSDFLFWKVKLHLLSTLLTLMAALILHYEYFRLKVD